MNTKRSISMVAVMALVLVAATVSPSLASAQKQVEGKFTLPCTTYWGTTILPAGDYTFSVSSVSQHGAVLSVRGEKSMRVTVIANNNSIVEQNALELKRSGSAAVVTKMYLAEAGISMQFRASASARELVAAATTPPQTELAKIIVTD